MVTTPRVPPRFVPTLTEVVQGGDQPGPRVPDRPGQLAAAALPTAKPMPTAPARKMLSEDFEELLVHRVMQRVDVSLDLRLRDAIASVVLEQTRSILPRLREEVESVVRHAVYEAVADELASKSNQ